MKTVIGGKEFNVVKNGSRFYYFSVLAGRLIPVSKINVVFDNV